MRSSVSMRKVDAVEHRLLRVVADRDVVDRDESAGDSIRSGVGKRNLPTSCVTRAVTGFIRSSILTRDCAWRALDAFALKRSTKALQPLALVGWRLACLA